MVLDMFHRPMRLKMRNAMRKFKGRAHLDPGFYEAKARLREIVTEFLDDDDPLVMIHESFNPASSVKHEVRYWDGESIVRL